MMLKQDVTMTIVAKGPDFWIVQLQGSEPEPGMLCTCRETGGVFRLELAGVLDRKAEIENKRIVRLYPVSGDGQLEEGWRLVRVAPPPHAT